MLKLRTIKASLILNFYWPDGARLLAGQNLKPVFLFHYCVCVCEREKERERERDCVCV